MKRVLCLVLMATMLFSMAFCHAETSVYPLEPVTLTVNMDETARESIPDWRLTTTSGTSSKSRPA